MNSIQTWKSSLCRLVCLLLLIPFCLTDKAQASETYSAFALGGYMNYPNSTGVTVSHVAMLMFDTPYSPRMIYNGYALFDLGALDTSGGRDVSSGNIVISGGGSSSNNDQNPETFLVHDVGVNLNDITRPPQGYSSYNYVVYQGSSASLYQIWSDLGSGPVYAYGSFTPSVYKAYSFSLTAQAIADINAAAGTVMGMGFQPTSGLREEFRSESIKLVLNRFNDPISTGGDIDFQLDDPNVSGQGTVDVTPLGVQHHLNSIATGQQTTDTAFSEVRRRFRFETAGDDTSVTLLGALDGMLEAMDGSASVDATIQLFDTSNGSLIDDDQFFLPIGPIGATLEQRPVDEWLRIEADLVPGNIYEIVSRIELTTSVTNEYGQARAIFDNTFDVQLVAVPEPSSLVLFSLAAVGLGAYWRRKRGATAR